MEKVFDFLRNLKPSFTDYHGFPTIKFYSDYIEVYFDSSSTITDLSSLDFSPFVDEFRLFPNGDVITIVYTFYISEHEA